MPLRNCVKVTVARSSAAWVEPIIKNIARVIDLGVTVVAQQLNAVSGGRSVEILLSGT